MPSNVRLRNPDTSLNHDEYKAFDRVDGGRVCAQFTVHGAQLSPPFSCAANDAGYGEIAVVNLTDGGSSFDDDFVRDGKEIAANETALRIKG